ISNHGDLAHRRAMTGAAQPLVGHDFLAPFAAHVVPDANLLGRDMVGVLDHLGVVHIEEFLRAGLGVGAETVERGVELSLPRAVQREAFGGLVLVGDRLGLYRLHRLFLGLGPGVGCNFLGFFALGGGFLGSGGLRGLCGRGRLFGGLGLLAARGLGLA